MTDQAAFLLARYDEDEAVALAANRLPGGRTGSQWVTDAYFERNHATDELDAWCERYWAIRTPMSDGRGVCELVGSGQDGGGCHTAEVAAHIARFGPARVLADIDAKRRIVAEMTGRYLESWTAAQTVLNALCLPHAGHPDYDPAWAL